MKRTLFTLLTIFAIATVVFGQNVPRKFVCVEVATSTTCYYCPGAALGLDDLVTNGKLVAGVENHCNIPSSGDPYVWAGSLARLSLYAINATPTTCFDGVSGIVGGNHTNSMYSQFLPKYNARIGVTSPLDMTMTYTTTDSVTYNLTIVVTKVGTVTATNLKLFVFICESNLAKNWQGLHWCHFVNRAMVPDQNGTAVSFSSGDTQIFNLTTTLNSTWVRKNLEFVATVQNLDASQGTFSGGGGYNVNKREQIQTVKSALNPLLVDFSSSADTVYENDPVTYTSTVSGGYIKAPVLSYEWIMPGATPNTSTDSTVVVSYADGGSYDVTLVVNKGGQVDTVTKTGFINVKFPVGIKEIPGTSISVYPNPNQGAFSVTFSTKNTITADLNLTDINGKVVYTEKNVTINNSMTKVFQLGSLPAGQYLLNIIDGSQKTVKKVVIN